MTIKELYDWAREQNIENMELCYTNEDCVIIPIEGYDFNLYSNEDTNENWVELYY